MPREAYKIVIPAQNHWPPNIIKLLRMVKKNDGNFGYTKSFLSFALQI